MNKQQQLDFQIGLQLLGKARAQRYLERLEKKHQLQKEIAVKVLEIPGQYILGVCVHKIATHQDHTYCKRCYCEEYEMDETSVSTATAKPQPDLQVEKHTALTYDLTCDFCGKEVRATVPIPRELWTILQEYWDRKEY